MFIIIIIAKIYFHLEDKQTTMDSFDKGGVMWKERQRWREQRWMRVTVETDSAAADELPCVVFSEMFEKVSRAADRRWRLPVFKDARGHLYYVGTGTMYRKGRVRIRLEQYDDTTLWYNDDGTPCAARVAWECDGPNFKWWRIIRPFSKWTMRALDKAPVYRGNLVNLTEAVKQYFVALLAGLQRVRFPLNTTQMLILPQLMSSDLETTMARTDH